MPRISVTATCKGSHEVVIVEIGGIAFETQAKSPEHAREIAQKTLKELGLCTTSTD